jgi:predicted unusual protein kinase regulating ubiquinone biosynthesis (AarF/ABC1/UbiB family)
MPGLEVKDVRAELHERVVEECDYELEASNHRRVERLRRGHSCIRVPAVDTELSRRRALVADLVDGIASTTSHASSTRWASAWTAATHTPATTCCVPTAKPENSRTQDPSQEA